MQSKCSRLLRPLVARSRTQHKGNRFGQVRVQSHKSQDTKVTRKYLFTKSNTGINKDCQWHQRKEHNKTHPPLTGALHPKVQWVVLTLT